MTNKLRLSYELGTIRDAINGAMLLAESLRDRTFSRGLMVRRTPMAASCWSRGRRSVKKTPSQTMARDR